VTVKILIVGPAWVGDMVMAHALVQTLVRMHGDVHIIMLAPRATQPLATRMPGVRESLLLDVGHGRLGFRERRRVARSLKTMDFDESYVLPNSFKSALVPFWAGVPRRVGWHGESRFRVLNDRRRGPDQYALMVDRMIALAHAPGADLPEPRPRPGLRVDEANRSEVRERLALETDVPVTALCPGAEYGPAKRWPPSHYATLARMLMDGGRRVWLVGSPNDVGVCSEIEGAAPGVVNLAGRTSLLDAVDVLSLADDVVCNDSGLMHVACALDRKVVALFGSTSPDYTPPLGRDVTVLTQDLHCSPCFQRECPLGHLDCLTKLTPESVAEAL
jgi:heptosyltransferase-2